MSLYITPFGRVVRRKMWAQPYRNEANFAEDEACDVFVPVNVKAEPEQFVITALLPGVKAEELAIQVVNETVTIQGEIKDTSIDADTYLLRESPTGRFYRAIRLPEPLDPGKSEADLNDGVLVLRVPKAQEARPRTIKVSAK